MERWDWLPKPCFKVGFGGTWTKCIISNISFYEAYSIHLNNLDGLGNEECGIDNTTMKGKESVPLLLLQCTMRKILSI